MSNEQKVLFEIVLENGEFKVNAKESADALGKVGDSAKKSEGAFAKLKSSWVATTAVALSVVYAFTKVGQTLGECIEYASKLQETQNKYDVVFKNSKVQANAFAKTLVESYGLATEEAMAFLAGTGDILTGLGMQSDKALDLSNTVAQLGIDLASFSNVEGGAERAIAALTSALTGEREALKAYGIIVSEEMIKAELQAQGKDKLTGLSLQQAKAEATLAIAYAQSGNAIGDMARSFDSYANIQRRVDSLMKDQKASIGAELVPALSNLGLAFLSAAKDGGVISTALKNIVKFIGNVMNGLAELIAWMDKLSEQKATKKMQEDNEKLFKQNEKNRESLIKQYGSWEKLNQAAAEGNSMAMMHLKYMEVTEGYYKGRIELTERQTKKEKEKADFLSKLQKSIEENDKKTDEQKAEIFAREKARAEELARIKNQSGATTSLSSGSSGTSSGKSGEPIGETDEVKERTWDEWASVGLSQASYYNSQLSQLYAMNTANHNAEIDNRTQKKLDAIEAEYEAEKAAIENSILTEEQKAERLKALDEKRSRDEKAIMEAADKEKRKLARESAVIQKKLAIADVLINTPAAALQAFRAVVMEHQPWTLPLGIAAAAATTGLGMAKLRLIQQQPLPSYAIGSWAVPRDQIAQIHKDEMIISKPIAQSIRENISGSSGGGSGTTIIVQGSIVDAKGLLDIVDDAQSDNARRSGRTIYSKQSPY